MSYDFSMSSTLVTVNLAIKPYLKKFLLSKSANKQEPLKFPSSHDYNIMLRQLTTNYNSLDQFPVADKQNVQEYFHASAQAFDEYGVTIILPFNRAKDPRTYNYLSVKSKKAFRREVRLDFNFEFARFLRRGMKDGIPRSEIINLFKLKHKISEDELKTETLYRYSSRLLEEM